MKKFVIPFISAAIIIGAVVFNISISSRSESMSDIALANIEALAQSETSDEFTDSTCCIACIHDHSCSGCDGKRHSNAHRK